MKNGIGDDGPRYYDGNDMVFLRTEFQESLAASRRALTLVELLVVIGIIAILIAILLPAMQRARQQANLVKCAAQMRDIGMALQQYTQANQGFLFPVGPVLPNGEYATLGYESTNFPPSLRWPARVFKMPAPPAGTPDDDDHVQFWTPKEMICPADIEPAQAHSYILNKHLADAPAKLIKYSSKLPDGRSPAEVVVMGEKVSDKNEITTCRPGSSTASSSNSRHGIRKPADYDPTRSNALRAAAEDYLYMDFHVDSRRTGLQIRETRWIHGCRRRTTTGPANGS